MRVERVDGDGRGSDPGFALLLAILALLLLTFLGLTLSTTSYTEHQIAFNYQISQQALYNAEAGVEAAKVLLRDMNWSNVLPPPRRDAANNLMKWNGVTAPAEAGGGADDFGWAPPYARADEWNNGTRNFENWQCDAKGNGMGYGVVLDDGTGGGAPFQYKTMLLGQTLGNGAFTLWIRRPLKYNGDATLSDYDDDDDTLILVAEGVAPAPGAIAASAWGQARQARQIIEVTLGFTSGSDNDPDAGGCTAGRWGQVGASALAANFNQCFPVPPEGGGGTIVDVVSAVQPSAPVGTGARLPQ